MPGAGVGAGISLAVLSADNPLLDALESVVTADHALNMCAGESELAEQIVAGGCGVAVIDADIVSSPISQLTHRLRAQFPDLVLIVAGNSDHQGQLAAQIASGAVYRFLHKPVSAQRVRLFVEAALRRHDEEHATVVTAAAPPVAIRARPRRASSKPPVAAIATGAVLLAIAGVWLALRDRSPSQPAASAQDAAAAPEESLDPQLAQLLQNADQAVARGELDGASPRSAPSLYREVLKRSPGNAAAAAGLGKVVDALLTRAEQSISTGQLEAASRALEAARALQPDNVRITFLTTQIGRERERALLTRARAAAASGDTDRALAVLGGSSPAAGASAQVTEAVRSLEQQQIDQRVADLLRRAGERLQRGAILEPASDNARFFLESARTLAPRDPAVVRMAQQLYARTLTEARAAATRADAAATERWLRAAGDLGASAAELSAARAQLASIQASTRNTEASRLAALVTQRIAQGRLVEPANDSARSYFAALQTLDPSGATTQSLRPTLSRALIAEMRVALGRSDVTVATQLLGEIEATGLAAAELGPLRADLTALRERVRQQESVVGVGALKRTRYVEPLYPREARMAAKEGWVELEFTVRADGKVADVRVTRSEPVELFDRAAAEALAKWRFEPVTRDGRAVDQRARMRMRFTLE